METIVKELNQVNNNVSDYNEVISRNEFNYFKEVKII
jgi:hypothetical protein